MESIRELAFKVIKEHKIKTLEEETMLGLYDIIDRMHKHAIQDYINIISSYYDDDVDFSDLVNCEDLEVKSEIGFNKLFKKNFWRCLNIFKVI